MASTTIRVDAETRDQLNELCAATGQSANTVIAQLVARARQETLLGATEAHWHAIATDQKVLALYKRATADLGAFDAELPDY